MDECLAVGVTHVSDCNELDLLLEDDEMNSDFFSPTSFALAFVIADSGSLATFAVFCAEVFFEERMLLIFERLVPFGLSISRKLGGQKPELLLPVTLLP